jgi:hypothetical protein
MVITGGWTAQVLAQCGSPRFNFLERRKVMRIDAPSLISIENMGFSFRVCKILKDRLGVMNNEELKRITLGELEICFGETTLREFYQQLSAEVVMVNIGNKSKGGLKLLSCPTCGAKTNEPCRTPKGRKKENVHDTRPFGF